ncbi:MAG: type II secretion system F family protein [Sulfurihydrogenibium sp.]|uniref:type II secretion system F family protein n=1 Tax=Sulfurihydrogenibium sp. TaxID=2053621 RepID=UPI003C79DAD5
MNEYFYEAYDKNGRKVSNIISAQSLEEAKSLLKNQEFVVVKIEPIKKNFSFKLFEGKITEQELYNFFKELSIMTKSGVKIEKALTVIERSLDNVKLKKIVNEIVKDIKSGVTLPSAFEKHSIFDSLIVAVIKTGDSTGTLSESFSNIAEYLKFKIQFKQEIKSALVYPIFLIFASFLTIFAMFKFIIPKFFSIFSANYEELPLISKILLNISNFFTLNPYFIGTFIMLIVGVNILIRTGKLKVLLDYSVNVPLLRNVVINLELSRFSYSMYSMLSSGIDFLKSLELSTNVVQNKKIKRSLESVIPDIRSGKTITESFRKIEYFPSFMLSLINVGEESGNLKDIFYELYTIFEERFKTFVKRTLTILEPAVITLTGIIVGFIVISLILTVMSMSNVKL